MHLAILLRRLFVFGLLFFNIGCAGHCLAAILVAAADSSLRDKARADYVCDGKDDQMELAAAFAEAPQGETDLDINPKTQKTVRCALNHTVEWAAGSYHLTETLEIPDAANCSIQALGTHPHYDRAEGDAIVLRGMNACRYQFGTVESWSSGAALRVCPNNGMPALMSFVDFTRLQGHHQNMLDLANENICVNRFTGTDVAGFDKGIFVGDAGGREQSTSVHDNRPRRSVSECLP